MWSRYLVFSIAGLMRYLIPQLRRRRKRVRSMVIVGSGARKRRLYGLSSSSHCTSDFGQIAIFDSLFLALSSDLARSVCPRMPARIPVVKSRCEYNDKQEQVVEMLLCCRCAVRVCQAAASAGRDRGRQGGRESPRRILLPRVVEGDRDERHARVRVRSGRRVSR